MSRGPIIGITTDIKSTDADPRSPYSLVVKGNYSQAVAQAGGVPILIPPDADLAAVLELVDGLLIPGGNDIDPAQFGQELHPEAELQHPDRFKMESALYQAAPAELPILGICYGCQLLNVLHGGTLIQHLPDVPGSTVHTGGVQESYELAPQSKMAAALGSARVEGRSYHHQAIDRPGEGVSVVGHAADGTIEAIEIEGRTWTLGTQWHPERTTEDPAMQSLFKTLVEQAKRYRQAHRAQPVGV